MRASFLLMALGCVCAIVCHLHTASGLSIALVGTSSSPALALFALRHASLASGGYTEYLSHSLSYIEYSNRDAVFNLALSLGQENITSRSSVLALDPELVVGGVLDVAMEYSERDVCPERYLSEKNLVCVPLAVSGLVPIVNLDGVVFGDGDLVLTREIIFAIWIGNITYWDNPVIVAVNEHSVLGHVPIRMVRHPSEVVGSVMDGLGRELVKHGKPLPSGPGGSVAAYHRPTQASAAITASSVPGAFTLITSERYSLGFQGLSTVPILSSSDSHSGKAVLFSSYALQLAATNLRKDPVGTGDATALWVSGAWPLSYLEWGVTLRKAPQASFEFCRGLEAALFTFQAFLNSPDVALEALRLGHATLPKRYAITHLPRVESSTCAGVSVARRTDILSLAGGSASAGLYTELFSIYTSVSGIHVRFEILGTDFARQRLFANDIVASSGSVPLLPTTLDNRPTLEILPTLASGLALVYAMPLVAHVGESLPPLILSRELLADIFLHKIVKWNDPAILALNPGRAPYATNTTICRYVRAQPAGLTQVFTEGLSAFSSEWTSSIGAVPYVPVWPGESMHDCTYRYGDDSDLGFAVATASSAIGYVSAGVAASLGLELVTLLNRAHEPVLPTLAAISAAVEDSFSRDSPHAGQPFVRNFIDVPAPGAWPFVFYSYFVTDPVSPGGLGCSSLMDWVRLYYWILNSEPGSVVPSTHLFVPIDEETRGAVIARVSTWVCDGSLVLDLCALEGTNCPRQPSEDFTASTSFLVLMVTLSVLLVGLGLLALLTWWRLSRDVVFTVAAEKDLIIDVKELTVGRHIGSGSYGSVFMGSWRGTSVAVKRFHGLKGASLKAFVDEATVVLKLRHPNVLLFMGIVLEPVGLVTEFAVNGTLYALLHNYAYSLPEKTVLSWAHSLAVAMDFLHSANILHRDLKSLNILLDAWWSPRIADFGLSTVKHTSRAGGASTSPRSLRSRGSATVAPAPQVSRPRSSFLASSTGSWDTHSSGEGGTGPLGSLFWLAPEVLSGGPLAATRAADVYAFAITMWEMLTRTEPYAERPSLSVVLDVAAGRARPNLALLPAWATSQTDLLERAWRQESEIRPTFRELALVLQRNCTAGPVPVPFKPQVPTGLVMALSLTLLDLPLCLRTLNSIPAAEALLVAFAKHILVSTSSTGAVIGDAGVNEALIICRTWPQVLAFLDALRFDGIDFLPQLRIVIAHGVLTTETDSTVPEPLQSSIVFSGPIVEEMSKYSDAPAACYVLASAASPLRSLATTQEFSNGWSGSLSSITREGGDPGPFLILTLVDSAEGWAAAERALEWGTHALHAPPSSSVTQFALWTRVARVPSTFDQNEDLKVVPPLRIMSARVFADLLDGAVKICVGSGCVLHLAELEGVSVVVKVLLEQNIDPCALVKFVCGVARTAAAGAASNGLATPVLALCISRPFVGFVVPHFATGSLSHVMATNRSVFEEEQCRHLAMGILDALISLHSNGFIHGGLKPTNVLLLPVELPQRFHVVLSDTGLATAKSSLSTMTMSPSVAFCPVEELLGCTPSVSGDIFSFASILFQVVTGTPAFSGRNALEIGTNILAGAFPDLSPLSPNLRAMFQSCWSSNPAVRPIASTLRELVAAMDDNDFQYEYEGKQ